MTGAFNTLGIAVEQIFDVFQRLVDHFGFAFILIGFFSIFTISRLLLGPLLGGLYKAGVSDRVKKIRGDEK